MNPVEISHLTKHYPDFSLNDVTFSVPAGYVTGFVGANGSGKTTTIKAALGMIHPDSGSATTVGHERIGVVFDAPPYNPEWRLKDLGRGIGRFFPTWSQERYDAELQAAGLAPTKKVKELSRGMGMRLQMAVALAHEPELLILDEPTNGLDPAGVAEIRELIVALARQEGVTVIVSSHILSEIEQMADIVGIICAGRLRYQGPLSGLQDEGVIDFTVSDPAGAAALFDEQRIAHRVRGRTVRIPMLPDEAVGELVTRIVRSGHTVFRVQTVRKTLEQAFLELTEPTHAAHARTVPGAGGRAR